MKNFKTLLALVIIMSSVTFSCKKNNKSSEDTTGSLNANIGEGKWRITLFSEDDKDETNHFTGDEFQFNAGGTVVAIHTGGSVPGTWMSGIDDSQLKLILSFGTAPYAELDDDWHVLEQNAGRIRLEDVSGGNGGTDLLTFEKI